MDWAYMVFGLSGCYLIGGGHRIGWALYAMASACLIYISLEVQHWGAVCAGVCFLALELRGFINHNKTHNLTKELK